MDNSSNPQPFTPVVPQPTSSPDSSSMKGQMIEFDAEKHNLKTYVIEFIQTLAVCLVVGIVIYWQIAQPHKVSGLSMFPTFHNNDYIITNKIGYKFNQPKRGDIVVLTNPRDLSEAFIKRIIGLPGEQVKCTDGGIYIVNKEYPTGMVLDESYLSKTVKTECIQPSVVIPEESYFVMGDNRQASLDSRRFGTLERKYIIGKVLLRGWPFHRAGLISSPIYQ